MTNRILAASVLLMAAGCGDTGGPQSPPNTKSVGNAALAESRKNFTTRIVKAGDSYGAPDRPPRGVFELIQYQSPAGPLAAYVSPDPRDGSRSPAIVWITGGDNNSIGDVWSPASRNNDQTVSAFRKAGLVVMFPSQRGGNNNPGQREGFFGEVDDILAATDHLASLPYVDPERIYLGGHSTGGTMAMLVGQCSARYKAVFSLGPVASVAQYGGEYVYCDPNNEQEILLRSPAYWLHCVKSPMFVFEGARDGNWDGSIDIMANDNSNPFVKFFRIDGHDHFSVIAPLAELIAAQIQAGHVEITAGMLRNLR